MCVCEREREKENSYMCYFRSHILYLRSPTGCSCRVFWNDLMECGFTFRDDPDVTISISLTADVSCTWHEGEDVIT